MAEVVAACIPETIGDQKLVAERVEKLKNNQTRRQPPKSPASADGPPKRLSQHCTVVYIQF